MNLPRTYQEEQWIKGGRRPEYKKFIGKPVISWTQVEGWTAKRGFNTYTSPGRKEYIRKYFLGEEFKDKGWREFGTDVEDYITTRNAKTAQKFTIEEVSTLDQIEPLGVFQDEVVIDFGGFCLLGYIDDYTPPDHNKRVRVLRDYKTKSKKSKEDLHQKDKFQLELYILGLQQRGLHIERAEYLIIERLGGRDCYYGKGRNSLSVGSNIWKEEYHFDQASIDRAKSVVKKVAQEISDYYTLFQRINGVVSDKNDLDKARDAMIRVHVHPYPTLPPLNDELASPMKRDEETQRASNDLLAEDLFNKRELAFFGIEGSTSISEIEKIKVNKRDRSIDSYGVDRIPREIGLLTNLRSLQLCITNLNEFPPEIGQLSNLEDLEIIGTTMKRLPAEIGQLANLNYLGLSGTLLNELPSEIGQLANLNCLGLSGTLLNELPSEIGQLSNLEDLDLTGCMFSELAAEISKIPSNLTTLHLIANELSDLTIEIGLLTNLETLVLNSNNLTTLPGSIGRLSNLEYLSLDRNPISSLPIEILELSNLEYLSLRETQLRKSVINRIREALPNCLISHD